MPSGPASGDHPVVLMPAGAPLLQAAAWVGASCHLELVVHERLTELLTAGRLPTWSTSIWTVRSHRAEIAEAWHRRLPELREFPREGFVTAPDGPITDHLGGEAEAFITRAGVLAALDALEIRYLEHLERAVGPADGPVADTLVRALATIGDDRLALA